MQLCEDVGFELPADLPHADRLTRYAAAMRYGLVGPLDDTLNGPPSRSSGPRRSFIQVFQAAIDSLPTPRPWRMAAALFAVRKASAML